MSIDLEVMSRGLSSGPVGSAPAYQLYVSADLDLALRERLAALPAITLQQSTPASGTTDVPGVCGRQVSSGVHNIRLIDARSGDPDIVNLTLASEYHHLPEYPIVLLLNPEKTEQGFLERLDVSDLIPLELVSESELDTPLFPMRLKLLAHRGQPLTGDPVQDNAYTILQQFMRVSNDWLVLKKYRPSFSTGNQCFLPCLFVIGGRRNRKNDIDIGTAEELVLGKPGTDWVGYWEQDTEIMESGVENVVQPLVLGDDDANITREKTVRIPLKDRNGDVFGMLVCVSEVNHPTDSGDDFSIGPGSLLQKSTFARSPALLAMTRENDRIESLRLESENAFIAKNQFIASASHDLRQPLHALGLFISALERRETDETTKSLIEKLKHCSESINDLLNGLLDISQLDANVISVDWKHFNIDELFVTLFEESISLADSEGLELQVHSDQSIVYSDSMLLGRILRNLLTNAITYTDVGLVTMSAHQNQNLVEITVADTGRGIPEKQQEAVFKEFHQLDHETGSESGGLGLGLAIVRRLCLLLDIDLNLQSSPGTGTRFTLMLPLGERSKVALIPEVTDNATFISADFAANILVVDDDSTVREAVELILQENECGSMSAESPDDALRKIESTGFEPDLILADFRLKNGQTGIDAVSRVRTLLNLPIPAIIITGDTSDTGLQELNRSGIRFLHKPVSAPPIDGSYKELIDGLVPFGQFHKSYPGLWRRPEYNKIRPKLFAGSKRPGGKIWEELVSEIAMDRNTAF